MIRINNLTLEFHHKTLLKGVSASFDTSKLTALLGRNGTGKSTLLRAICGLNYNYTGEIIIDNENIKDISAKCLAKKLAYVNTQRPRMSNLRVWDVVALGRSPYTGWGGKISNSDKQRIQKALEDVEMLKFSQRYFNTLSDGESQKVMIARAIAQDTEIIILDEPTSFLDLPTRYELAKLLKKLTLNGKTIIYSTHELDLAQNTSDYLAIIDNCKLDIIPTLDTDLSKIKDIFKINGPLS